MNHSIDDNAKTREQLIAELNQLRAELSDRQQLEAELRHSQRFIEKVTNDLPHHIYIYDLETFAPLYANHAVTHILGYTPEQVLQGGGQFFVDILHPDDQARLADFYHRWATVNDGEVVEFDDFRFRHANGSWQWMKTWQVVFARDEQGKPTQILGSTIDITECKLAEAAQRRSESKFTQFFHANPDAVAITTFPEGRFVEVNKSFCQITGLSAAAVIGKTSRELGLWRYPEAHNQLIEQLEVLGSIKNFEFDFRTNSGEIKTGLMSIDLIHIDGQLLGISVVKDISDRKRMEEDLRRSNALLQAQQEASVAGIWVVNEHREVIFYNQRFCEVWHIPQDIIATHDYWLILNTALAQLQDPAQFLARVEALYQNPEELSHDEIFLKDGRILERHSAPMRSATGTYYGRVWHFQDITERKQAQAALHQSQERYVLATRAARVGVWELNYRTGEFYLDPNIKTLLGYSETELPNSAERWLSIFPPEDQRSVLEMSEAYVKGERSDWAIEHRVFHKDGSIRWLMARGTAVRDAEHNILRLVGTATDITELKSAEQALRRSNAMLKVQQDAAIDGILITDEHQKVVSYNQRFCQLWRMPESVIQQTENDHQLRETVLDQLKDPEAFLAQVDYLNQHPELICRDEILFKDGRIFDRYSAAVKSFEGDDFGRIWYFRDITDIKQIEAALRQNEQKFLQLTQNIRDVFFIAAPDFSQTFYVSPAYEEVWGRSCASLYQNPKSWMEAVHPDDQARILPACHTLTAPAEQSLEYRIIRPHGDTRWVLVRTFPIFGENGQVDRLAGIIKDITDRKQIEAELEQYQNHLEAIVVERTTELNQANQRLQEELQQRTQVEATLREAERRWRSVMEDVRLLVIGVDTQLNITYANPFILEVLGYSQSELMDKKIADILVPSLDQSIERNQTHSLLIHQVPVYFQKNILTKSGEIRRIAWNITQLRDPQGQINGILGIGEDITERYQIERIKDEFISVVSHEFRTPLTAIHGAIDLISDGLIDIQSDRAQQLLQIAAEGTERLVYLVDNILDLERLESGKLELIKHSYNIGDLMLKAIDLMQFAAHEAEVHLSVLPLSFELQLDGDRILQVLTNLLSNAIKFSPPGCTVWLQAEIEKTEYNRSNGGEGIPQNGGSQSFTSHILLTVRDQGRGIPTDKLETIFERFQQVDVSDSRQKGGTGLGLAICRSIVQQHGGQIWVESLLHTGSCFYVQLPILE